MIYLPLLCLGLEYIFEKRGYKLFTFMIFISVISNFYFFYMLSILIFLYAVYRYFELYTLKDYKVLFSLLFKSIGSYVLGIMMGSVIFIPVINQFFNAGRGEIHSTLLPFYTKSFYLNFVKTLFHQFTEEKPQLSQPFSQSSFLYYLLFYIVLSKKIILQDLIF